MDHRLIITPRKLVQILLLCLSGLATACWADEGRSPFTVSDGIGLAHFGDPYGWDQDAVRFSPDGNYFAVYTERGHLDTNSVEDSLRFYRSQDATKLLDQPAPAEPPSPFWIVTRSDGVGGTIGRWRWLADSSGVAFLERQTNGNKRLVIANLRTKHADSLTPEAEAIDDFDVISCDHYVYTKTERQEMDETVPLAVSGHSLMELIFPKNPKVPSSVTHTSVWAVANGKPFEIKKDGASISPGRLALSPDGKSLVTTLPVLIPKSWESLYPPPFASDPTRFHAGDLARQYVLVNLQTGSIQPLTDAPAKDGLWASVFTGPSWSSDGRAILLPGTFLKLPKSLRNHPCIAVVNLASNEQTCLEPLKGRTETGVEEGYRRIRDATFMAGNRNRVSVVFERLVDRSFGSTEYGRRTGTDWQIVRQRTDAPEIGSEGLEVIVKQGINDPPLLAATNGRVTRVLWDPNPQLKEIELGEAELYTWKNNQGRTWLGGLYKPVNYRPGQRYPLVIQTHDFSNSLFETSGTLPTAFAARALAAVGIMVLQVDERCPGLSLTPNEARCAAAAYESAAKQLTSEGLVDPDEIGIIGFSRSCLYVMKLLTTSPLHIKAASLTDGWMLTYIQYMLFGGAKEGDTMIGAAPFGNGLELWLKRSPGFNLDQIRTPLLVNAVDRVSVIAMWEPYAGLRYLHKPVDMIMLNSSEHVLSNPAARVASQGGTVDWFRFWLQDHEDPDPAKKDQYKRWRDLKKLQTNESELTMPHGTSN